MNESVVRIVFKTSAAIKDNKSLSISHLHSIPLERDVILHITRERLK